MFDPDLKARAADAKELEKQPACSLVVLAQMLIEADDLANATVVLQAGRRRFPRDVWVCLMLARANADKEPKPDLA